MRNHEQLFAEVREAFIDMDVAEEVSVKRIDLALHELDEIEAKYAPDWEAAVMNMLVFIGIMAGTISAEVYGGGVEDELHDKIRVVFEILAKYYAIVK
jgi:hypothetical protein